MDRRILVTILYIFFLVQINAQEYETGLSYNPNLKEAGLTLKSATAADTLALPFFDDFSGSDVYPNSKYWADNNVYINSTYEVDPVSTGVATFDALDESGNIYDIETSVFGADTLTSNPINLSNKDDVFLSFFYQPMGLGNRPEAQDSLKLEFKNPGDSVWVTQFQVEGTESKPFKQIILPVEEPYLFNGFQFRFINFVSLTTENNYDGFGSNSDSWNLDYVYFDENRSLDDTTYHDVTIATPVPSIFVNYESIPWKHFSAARLTEKATQLPITVSNLNQEENEELQINVFYYYRDNNNPDVNNEDQYFWFNLPPQEKTEVPGDLNFDFIDSPSTDNAEFFIRLNIKDDAENLNIHRENDTITKTIKLQDYYAYDDGSPEGGYGFKGNAVKNVMVALRFNTYKKDTLKNIYMYFNPTNDSTHNNLSFELRVWNSLNDEPGEVIYEKTVYVNSLSKEFEKYQVEEEIILDGDFFIGWRHLSNAFLNVGLDKNNPVKDKTLINTSGYWSTSSVEGAIMMRPGFGTPVVSSIDNQVLENKHLKIYPNPANEFIYIDIEEGVHTNDCFVEIIDLYGRSLIKAPFYNTTGIDISSLKRGVYLVVLKNSSNILAKQKLLVQ